ncbi:MAG: effector binding domain-containing protein [Bacilli bacterium]|uniref:MerR family transcriptional regulator n=1 Tax=Anaerorhabdus sp. TaxID=1872524 RepID=UPI002FC5D2CB
MKSNTISQVSKTLGISTRMLRYYEQIGLIHCSRLDDYAYRVYDLETIEKLKQILLLRKLRIPVKQIKTILLNPNAINTVKVFEQNIMEIDEEITALATIKDILLHFIQKLSEDTKLPLLEIINSSTELGSILDSLNLISINFKEDQTMRSLKKADEKLSILKDVRIIYLPPTTVASAHHIGDDPEFHANKMIDDFVRNSKLDVIKPDLRHYGFNHPNPIDETGYHGYESWITIPHDLEVPKPLTKKEFNGGLYAAHMISFGNFNEWEDLAKWVNDSEEYDFAGDWLDQEHMCGLMDEHLNYYSHIHLENTEPENMQIDLLMPIKEIKRKEEGN